MNHLNRDLKLLSLALFLWAVGEGLFIFTLPIFMSELGASPKQIGDIFSIGAVAMGVTFIPAGWASDRFGPKSGLISGWIIGALSVVFFAIARDVSVFLIGWILYRATAWVLPPVSAYTTNARGGLTPERALSSVYSMFHAGLIISPAIGGYIGENFGLRTNFYFAAVLFVSSTVVILFLRPQPPHPVEARARPTEILRSPGFLRFLLLVLVVTAVMYVGYDFAPKYLSEVKSIQIDQIGWLGSVNALGGFTLNQLLGRRPPRRMLMVAIGLMFVYGVVLLQSSWVGWFGLAYFLRGSVNSARSLISALVTRLVQPSQLGMAFGLTEMIAAGGDVIAPALAGRLYEASPQLPFIAMMAMCPIIIAMVWLFAPRPAAAPQAEALAVSAD
jgi:MFS family permease